MTRISPYGTWTSPITPESLCSAPPRIQGARLGDGYVWWSQNVAAEGGRGAIFRKKTDQLNSPAESMLPEPWSVSSKLHEYGGGAWELLDDNRFAFVNKKDQQLYLWHNGQIQRIGAELPQTAQGGLSYQNGQLLVVREEHKDGLKVPYRSIVAYDRDALQDPASATARLLADGSDFLAHPALSPDNSKLSWIAWDHPNMPWDNTQLRYRELDAASATSGITLLAGERALLQAQWLNNEELSVLDDQNDRWQLSIVSIKDATTKSLSDNQADIGGPLWNAGMSWYEQLDQQRFIVNQINGSERLAIIDLDGETTPLDFPLTSDITIQSVVGSQALVSGSSAQRVSGLYLLEIENGQLKNYQLVTGAVSDWDNAYDAIPEAISFVGASGTIHGFVYPPTNPDFKGPAEEKVPYVIMVHGGPTGSVSGGASAAISLLTSRGIGVFDLNYSGSTGYGRAYRERLKGNWGIADVADAITAAEYLGDSGIADPDRIAIAGGSAGGWTVMRSLCTSSVFAGGISSYGVVDARGLAQDTHDFESRYLDGLIGPLPDAEERYIALSPLELADQITSPVLLLQGEDDAVVPPSQSERMREHLAKNRVRHAYLLFPGEGHGFRRSETIVAANQAKLSFLASIFGYQAPDVPELELS